MISALYNLSLPVFNEEWYPFGIMSSVGDQEDRFGMNCWTRAGRSRFVDLQSVDQRVLEFYSIEK
jgi:hypothetical protein